MEHSSIALIFISFSSIVVIFFKPSKITNYPSFGKTIVAFGDSLVAGKGASQDCDFVTLVSEEVGEPIINLGVPGNTTYDGLKRLHLVLEKKPKVVLVLLGGNDYFHEIPQEETFKNIDTIVTKIQEKGAVVVLLGIQGGILTDPYDKDFRNIARKRGTLYVSNVLDGLIGNEDFMSDQVHPNDRGYRMVANKVYPVLQKAL